jgi:hypothetical protein
MKTMYAKNRKWTLQYENPIARPVANHLISYNAPRTMTKRPMKVSWQRNQKKWWKQWMQKNYKWSLQLKNPITRLIANHFIFHSALITMTKKPTRQSQHNKKNKKNRWEQWMPKTMIKQPTRKSWPWRIKIKMIIVNVRNHDQ